MQEKSFNATLRNLCLVAVEGFLGLSGAILVQIYKATFNDNPSSFLLMLSLLPTFFSLLLRYFVRVHNTNEGDDYKYLIAFSFIYVAVVAYLMIVIIRENFIIFLLLLLFLLSSLIILLKAQFSESTNISECSLHVRIKLIEDTNPLENKERKSARDQVVFLRGESMNLLQAMWTCEFWLLFLTMACAMGSGLATVNNISQIGTSLGYSDIETTTLVTLWSI